MKGILIGLVLIVLVVGGFYAFSGNDSNVAVDSDSATSGSSSGNSEGGGHGDMDMSDVDTSGDAVVPDSATTETDSSGATTHNVVIDNFKLPSLTVKVGDTVSWTNEDGAPHTATANGGSFDTDRLETGESGSFTFTSAGEFDYFCAIHPSMKGKVTVK